MISFWHIAQQAVTLMTNKVGIFPVPILGVAVRVVYFKLNRGRPPSYPFTDKVNQALFSLGPGNLVISISALGISLILWHGQVRLRSFLSA
jgi:hypothetical protein